MDAPTLIQAGDRFDTALKVPERLLAIEADGDWGRGFPAKQQALRGAAVVLTVACWQTLVEDVSRAVLRGTAENAGSKGKRLADLAAASLDESVERFNTPNMTNVKNLFDSAGFQLGTAWSASDSKGTLNSQDATAVIDAWLHARHSLAHGVPFHTNTKLTNLRRRAAVKSRVVTGRRAGRGGGLALGAGDANACRDLFASMRQTVTSSAQQHLDHL